ncbi:MAG: aminotransferase class I/II-fold pyridoxal phosphate-dependent enzyme [Cyanobium sp.]
MSPPDTPPPSTAALATLANACGQCRRCALAEGRQRVVVSRGNPEAPLMVVGEGPGAQEDAQGVPFVGRAGQLLDQMLASVGIDSNSEAYICNVVIPTPCWLSDPPMAELAGASVQPLPTEASRGFRFTAAELEQAITPATRLLVLNSPSNPTGMVLERSDLEAIADVLRRHPEVAVVCDEIYEALLAPGYTHHSLAAMAPDLAGRIFIANGFAKGWAMTGWRVGWLFGPAHVVAAACALQSQSTSNVCSFAQFGALAAIQGSRDCVLEMAERFNERRQLLSDGLAAVPGLGLVPPKGAFYAFPDISAWGLDSMTLCNRLLDEVGLAAVPGVAFGDDRCIRLSCAASTEAIQDGLQRLGAFPAQL